MAFSDIYGVQPDAAEWTVPQNYDARFTWTYSDDRKDLLNLYAKGKQQQWDAEYRIDWDQEIDFDNPQGMPVELFALHGYSEFEKMSPAEKATVRRNSQAWGLSQFLHGEQGALLCSAKIVTQVPDLEAKFYASTQTIDEARHVEAYKRLLEKIGLAHPMTGPLKTLLDQVLRDNRWDMTYLGMQVVIEGLALAAFAGIRDYSSSPLAASVNAYVMQDEARHVAFGRLTLRNYYPQLTEYERREREQFLIEACYHMRDRFEQRELWEHLGLDVEGACQHMAETASARQFRNHLFNRIVPVVKDIGLWGETVQKGYADMGVLDYVNVDLDALQANDDQIAQQFDARRKNIEEVAAIAAE
jgi:hypothetical protein